MLFIKKHKKAFLFLLVLVLLWVGAFIWSLTVMPYRYEGEPLPETAEGEVRFVNDGTGTPYLAKYGADGEMLDVPFKVITIGDSHLTDESGDIFFEKLTILLDQTKPDLIVLLGDLILSGKEDIQNKLADYFEGRKQYWGFVPGNHDGQEYAGTDDRYEQHRWWYPTMTGSPYCVCFDEGGDEVYGFGNCAINIRTPKGISQTLFFIDNSVDNADGFAIDINQVQWYERKISEIREENGGSTVPSTVFMHRPIEEYQDAWDLAQKGEAELVYGDCIEEIEYGQNGSLIYEKAKELGSTHTFICGHEHKNDTRIILDGINMIYTQGLHFETYGRSTAIKWKILYAVNRKCNWFTEGGTGLVYSSDGGCQIVPCYIPLDYFFYTR